MNQIVTFQKIIKQMSANNEQTNNTNNALVEGMEEIQNILSNAALPSMENIQAMMEGFVNGTPPQEATKIVDSLTQMVSSFTEEQKTLAEKLRSRINLESLDSKDPVSMIAATASLMGSLSEEEQQKLNQVGQSLLESGVFTQLMQHCFDSNMSEPPQPKPQ